MPTLWRVNATHYVAGLEVDGGIVVRAAPILRWAKGRQFDRLHAYLSKRGYAIEQVPEFGAGVMV